MSGYFIPYSVIMTNKHDDDDDAAADDDDSPDFFQTIPVRCYASI